MVNIKHCPKCNVSKRAHSLGNLSFWALVWKEKMEKRKPYECMHFKSLSSKKDQFCCQLIHIPYYNLLEIWSQPAISVAFLWHYFWCSIFSSVYIYRNWWYLSYRWWKRKNKFKIFLQMNEVSGNSISIIQHYRSRKSILLLKSQVPIQLKAQCGLIHNPKNCTSCHATCE